MARTLLATLVCLPLALASEIAALLELLLADGPLGARALVAITGLHLFAAVMMAEGLRLRYPAGAAGEATAWRTGLGLSLLLPLYGLVVTALLILRTPRVPRAKLEDFTSPMEHRKQQAEAELAAEAAKGMADVNVEAIGEALKDTDKAKRLGAVEALRALQNKQAIGLLNKSLRNTVFEVRYHAVEALAGISKKYSERIARATTALEGDPSPAKHRALGDIYYEYATLEMEEASIQLHLYRNALEHLRNALQPDRPDPAVLVRVALCLERLGESDAAWRAYKDVLAAQPASTEALLGVARLQYSRGQFDQLRDTCRRLLDIPDASLDAPTSSVLALWAEGPQDEQAQVRRTRPPVMR